MTILELKGVVPALTTPFDVDEGLDLAALRKLIDLVIDDGYIDSSTPVLGKRSREFYDTVVSGDLHEAHLMQADMATLNAAMFGVGTFPAGVKAALDLLGRPGGWPRDPIKPLSPKQRDTIRAVLEEIHLLPASPERMASA